MRLLLASNSPRRRELLAGLDIPMQVVKLKDIDETHPAHLQGADIPLHIARLKMEAYDLELQPDEVLITADTIVWVPATELSPGIELGKPHDAADARRMLRLLSGRTHQVYTAVCLRSAQSRDQFVCCTDVTFDQLTDQQIDYYIQQYRPFDKAGAYGIQEWIGYVGCTRLEGSYFNVMGLPVQKLYTHLQKLNV